MARICSGLALVAAAALLMATQAQALDTCPAGCSTCGDLCICNDTPTYNGKALAPWSSAVEGKATIYNMSPTGTATISKALVDVIDPFAPGKGVVWTENTSGCNGAVLQPGDSVVCSFTAIPDYITKNMRTEVHPQGASCIATVTTPTCEDPQPVEAYDFVPIPISLKQQGSTQTGTAQVTVYAENWTAEKQTITMSSSVAQTVTESATWTKTSSQSWGTSVSIAPKLLPFSLGASYGQVNTDSQGGTTTDTYQTTVTNQVATVITPYNNCSASGTIKTSTVIFTQDFIVSISMTCGDDRQEIWTQQLALSGVAAQAQTVNSVTYNPCQALPMPFIHGPPTETCDSNPVCQQMGFQGTCCPKTVGGVYMSCCAQAKAHPECPPDMYQSPEDAICPSRTGQFLSCCKNKLLMSSRPPTNNANNTSPSTAPASPSPAASPSTAPASPSPAASPAAQPSNGDSGTDSSNTADSANSASDSGSIKRAVGLANGVAAKLPLPGAMGRKLQAWP